MALTFSAWRRDNSGTRADYEEYLRTLAEAARTAGEPSGPWLSLLASYASGPKIWDATDLLPGVWDLTERGLIEPAPGHAPACQLTQAGRRVLRDHGVTANETDGTLSLTPEEAVVAWRALDEMGNASSSTKDDAVIARVTAHFARQLPPRPASAPHDHG